jgi:hypothetical protein
MYNWSKMCSNPDSFTGLHEELRNCGGRYTLDKVRMPPSCGNRICTIEFKYYDENFIKMTCVDAPVLYSGTNSRIRQWLENGTVEFSSFEQLTAFLEQFGDAPATAREVQPRDAERTTVSPVPKSPKRPEMEYDREGVTVPEGNKTYVVIDRERLEIDLNEELFGQEENVKKIVHLVRNHLATKNKKRPISIFLYGPPGTGKSAVVELLVGKVNAQLSPRKKLTFRPVDCTQFQEKADISKLIGAAPGYVGFDEPGVFSVLEDHPNTVFVFDEIEKAASNVTEVIMQAMETGRQETNGKTLSNGESFYDLSRCIIFFTSNVALDEKKTMGFGGSGSKSSSSPASDSSNDNIARVISRETREAKEKLLETGKFRREVISRMSAIIKFDSLSGDAIKDIAAKSIRDVGEAYNLYITKLDTAVLQEFINITSEETGGFGAREMRREAENFFGDALLEYSLTHPDYSEVIISGTLDDVEVVSA